MIACHRDHASSFRLAIMLRTPTRSLAPPKMPQVVRHLIERLSALEGPLELNAALGAPQAHAEKGVSTYLFITGYGIMHSTMLLDRTYGRKT